MPASALKFKAIAVATDLADTASSAWLYAQAIARLHGSELILIQAPDPVGYAFSKQMPGWLRATPGAQEELAAFQEEMRRHGVFHPPNAEGAPVREMMLEAVKDHHCDLLVLGTRRETAVGRAALGKVARQLLAVSPCPILTISPDADASLQYAGRWRNVLAAIDFSPVSVSALLCAHQMASKQLIVLHAPLCHSEDECSKCLERLRFLAPFNESHSLPVEHIVRSGDAHELIVEYAARHHADLIILGSPVDSLSEPGLPASTVLQVVSKATCPVLCMPTPRRVAPLTLIREVSFAR